MGVRDSADPRNVADYRDTTRREKNPTIMQHTFWCKGCDRPRHTAGRKRIESGEYRCKSCCGED